MTHNPTTKGMSEAEVLAAWDSSGMAVDCVIDSCNSMRRWQEWKDHKLRHDAARSTIESKFAELTVSRVEIAVLHVHLQDALECEKIAAEQRDEFRAAYAYLMKVAPWAESNDMTAADEMICGIDGILQQLRDAESDRTALLEVVRRLLQLVDDRRPEAEEVFDEASALLSRITAPEASR